MDTSTDLDRLRSTRLGLQTVAEHVLAPALYQATGHIGLRQAAGGIATPPFPGPAGDRTVGIDHLDLVVRDGGGERRAALTTVRAAGELAGVVPGAPADLYTPATPLDLDAPLVLDAADAARLEDWYALVDAALAQLQAPTVAQLWPEHFDLAVPIGEVNYGGSPGDATHPIPYLYVGPWAPPAVDGGYWNEAFGASRLETDISGVDDAVAFFREGRTRLGG